MHIYFSNSLELLSFTFRVSDLETLLLLEVWSLPVFLAGTAGTERLSGVHPCCEMALAYEPACLEPPSIWSNEYKDVFDFVFGWVDLVMWGNAEGEHQEIMRHGHIAPCLVIQWVWDCDVWKDGRSPAGNSRTIRSPSHIITAQLLHIQNVTIHTHINKRWKKQHNSSPTHGINPRQLHADVDHCNSEDLPADTAVHEEAADREGLHGGQRALLLLHLFNLSLNVSFSTEPL